MSFRPFTFDDQIAFADLSGDHNPMHVDALAARRMMFGTPVVHGIHSVLRALDYSLAADVGRITLTAIRATFKKPVRVGDELELAVDQKSETSLQIRLLNDGAIATTSLVEWEPSQREFENETVNSDSPIPQEPLALTDDEIAADSGSVELPLNIEAARALFPNLMERLPATQVSSILHLSRLVGVRCPGLHSLFLELSLTHVENSDHTNLHYEVASFDQRIGLVTLNVSAPGLAGTVKAFRRPAPKEQARYVELKQRVTAGEFANQRALIIGGSRGLGEVTAKLLAGGGADVRITYHRGKDDAQGVVSEIVAGGGAADCFQYDVLNPAFSESDISTSGWTPTHLYYFATPFIFSGVKGKFSPELFRQFCDYYVTGFSQALELLREFQIEKVFYPSSAAIDELPKSMGEYASAKLASELLCDFLEKCNPETIIYKSRFPRTETDQTVSIIPVKSEDPVELMIRELRTLQTK